MTGGKYTGPASLLSGGSMGEGVKGGSAQERDFTPEGED